MHPWHLAGLVRLVTVRHAAGNVIARCNMARPSSVERREFWRRLLREHRASGLSIRSFCEASGVSEPSFHYWRRQLRRTGNDSVPDPQTSRRSSRHFVPFVPVKIQPTLAPAMVELVHRSGHVLRIPAAFDVEALAGILAVLDREGA